MVLSITGRSLSKAEILGVGVFSPLSIGVFRPAFHATSPKPIFPEGPGIETIRSQPSGLKISSACRKLPVTKLPVWGFLKRFTLRKRADYCFESTVSEKRTH